MALEAKKNKRAEPGQIEMLEKEELVSIKL
jgi:hypothetical protein